MTTATVVGAPLGPRGVHRITVSAQPTATLRALGEEVAAWGGEWTGTPTGGTLRLPVQAGLRFGLLEGNASTQAIAGGTDLTVEIVAERWRLDRGSTVILATAAVASVAAVLWPFFPSLQKLAPLGLVLGVSAWLAVVSRLRHHGVDELLAEVAAAFVVAPPPSIEAR